MTVVTAVFAACRAPSKHTVQRREAFSRFTDIFIQMCAYVMMLYPLGVIMQVKKDEGHETWEIWAFFVIVAANFAFITALWMLLVRKNVTGGAVAPVSLSCLGKAAAIVRAVTSHVSWDVFQAVVSIATSISYILYTYSGVLSFVSRADCLVRVFALAPAILSVAPVLPCVYNHLRRG